MPTHQQIAPNLRFTAFREWLDPGEVSTLTGEVSNALREAFGAIGTDRGELVSGVVDWQSASTGPPSVDIGHCRSNLLRYGQPIADRFTRYWEQLTGDAYDPVGPTW